MAHTEAHWVARDGSARSAPARHWTDRSVFLVGVTELSFGDRLHLVVEGARVEAWVAFVAERPAGAVLVFEDAADARTPNPWEEDETGRHDTEEALEEMMARATEAAQDGRGPFASEDPTNTGVGGARGSGRDGDRARAALSQTVPSGRSPRLRATTEVSELPPDADPDHAGPG